MLNHALLDHVRGPPRKWSISTLQMVCTHSENWLVNRPLPAPGRGNDIKKNLCGRENGRESLIEIQAEDISFHAPIWSPPEGAHCLGNVYKTRWNRCVLYHWIFSASPLLHGCAHHVQADFFRFPTGTTMVPPLRQALHLSSCPKVPDAMLRCPQDPTHMCVTQGIGALSPHGATSDQGDTGACRQMKCFLLSFLWRRFWAIFHITFQVVPE